MKRNFGSEFSMNTSENEMHSPAQELLNRLFMAWMALVHSEKGIFTQGRGRYGGYGLKSTTMSKVGFKSMSLGKSRRKTMGLGKSSTFSSVTASAGGRLG